jgi:hypothetical protein
VAVVPGLYSNTQAIYSLTLSTSKTLTAALFSNSPAFYAPVVSLGSGPQVIASGLFANQQSYFTQIITPGQVSLFPLRLTNSHTFYSAALSDGAADLPDAAPRYTVTAIGRHLSTASCARAYKVIK